jgi:hypothetical protein
MRCRRRGSAGEALAALAGLPMLALVTSRRKPTRDEERPDRADTDRGTA